MQVRSVKFQEDPQLNILDTIGFYTEYSTFSREKLFEIITNTSPDIEYINAKAVALGIINERLETESNNTENDPGTLLSDQEVEKLFNIVKDEADFPILLDRKELNNGSRQSDDTKTIRDIEENAALFRGTAALLIVDYGYKTKKFEEIKKDLTDELKDILGNMLSEQNQLFLREDGNLVKISSYFRSIAEALFFIDEEAARKLMSIFSVKETDFSFERRKRKRKVG